MSDKLSFSPAAVKEALAILYLQKQDLSNASPEDLAKLYLETYSCISSAFNAAKAEAKSTVDY